MQPQNLINPSIIFGGIFIPDWLLRRTEVSQGAKLLYAALRQYADIATGEASPKQATLAVDLGVGVRQVGHYLNELRSNDLIEVHQIGLQQPNRYLFLTHPWMYGESE